MELKNYQQQVLRDLETFLEYLVRYKDTENAFNLYWADKIGPHNPLTGEGMQPYKNNLNDVPHVCIKVPTAGGKTLIACHALHSIFRKFLLNSPKTVIWLVPWSNLLDQTVKALRNPEHPYREKLNRLFQHRVEIYEKKDLLSGQNFNPTLVAGQLSVIVMSFSSLRIKNKENRKVYQENSQLMAFVPGYKRKNHLLADIDESSLINVLRSMDPVLVVDESHNAETMLSIEMLKTLNPSFVLDLTATPKEHSNLISLVPAIELKKEQMVKLPVIVYNHKDKTEVVNSALHLQRKLELIAREQEKKGGKYIRPIVLFQAQPKTASDNTTFVKLKEQLLKSGIPEEEIKIKTAEKDELKNIDLSSENCPVRYIITINALKEGWDCPFAYILASLADKSSVVEVEQILGRVLRLPYVQKYASPLLNSSYVLTASAKFYDTLQNIVHALQASGFSERDYRHKDGMMAEKKGVKSPADLFGEHEIEIERILYKADPDAIPEQTETLFELEKMAIAKNADMEFLIQQQRRLPLGENVFQEMGEKVKRYKLRKVFEEITFLIELPMFLLLIPKNDIFKTHRVILNRESLIKGFKLSEEDSKIDLEAFNTDLYQVDIEATRGNEYDARFTKLEDQDPVVNYILARPRESQIRDVAHQILQVIGTFNIISDQELRAYLERVLSHIPADQLPDIMARKYHYASKIKGKIKQLIDRYAERRFYEMIKVRKIVSDIMWKFPMYIVPGHVGPPLGKSLYEREGFMNRFETAVITELSSLPDVMFWHRNLGRGRGFSINGYKSDHYPDFIIFTHSGKFIVIEAKGDDRDNSDSAAKCKLGNKWAEMAGWDFYYFMIFDTKELEGAYTLEKAKELIRQIK